MYFSTLLAISPVDGRYRCKTESLKRYFTTDRLEAGKNPTPMNVVDSFYDAMQNFEKIACTVYGNLRKLVSNFIY